MEFGAKKSGVMIMRINFRLKLKTLTLFGMLAKTQKVEGITSKVVGEKDLHYVFWDLEECSLRQCETSLRDVQDIYNLGTIYILSDFPRSFRAICWDKITLIKYLKILINTQYLDYGFFYYTVRRGKSTIRYSQKYNRKEQKIVSVLHSFDVSIPEKFETVKYETGTEKKGILLELEV